MLNKTIQIEILKNIVPFKTNLILKTWITRVGTTSIDLEHEFIEEASNQVIIRASVVLIAFESSSSQFIKKEIMDPQSLKNILKPRVIQFDTQIPKRPSNSFIYSFSTRPSDKVNQFSLHKLKF